MKFLEINFKKLLLERGTNQLKLAKELGWFHTKLNWIVKGYSKPKPEEIQKICQALNVSENEIWDGSHENG